MNIKRPLLLLLIALIIVFNVKANWPEYNNSGDGMVLDVKTNISNRLMSLEMNAISIGTTYYLKAFGYRVQEMGERYAVWIKNYEKWESSDRTEYVIKLEILLTTPSNIREGTIIKREFINYIIQKEEVINLTTSDDLFKILDAKFKTRKDHLLLEGKIIGRMVAEKVKIMIFTLR